MADSKLEAYGDVVVVTGKYEKDGKERNRYSKVGTLFATPHFSRISIKLDVLPRGEWLNVFPNKPVQENKKDNVVDVDPNEPINLDDIPF